MWVESQWGKVRCVARYSEAVEPGTVWTWNAIGKAPGAWALAPDANESQRGFLLNHLITEELPGPAGAGPSPTPTRSPARRPGTTCACASTAPTPTSPRPRGRSSRRCPPRPARATARPRWLAYFAGEGRGK